MGNGTYIGGSTIIRPTKTVRDPKKDLREKIYELEAIFLRMQLNSKTAENEIRELKRLLRLVTLNPKNTDTTRGLLSSDEPFIEMILEYLKSIGHKSTKIWSYEEAFKYQRNLAEKDKDKPPQAGEKKPYELDEIEGQYRVEAKRFSRSELKKEIQRMKIQASKNMQSISQTKICIFQEIYNEGSPNP